MGSRMLPSLAMVRASMNSPRTATLLSFPMAFLVRMRSPLAMVSLTDPSG